jgi:hypothetical protein
MAHKREQKHAPWKSWIKEEVCSDTALPNLENFQWKQAKEHFERIETNFVLQNFAEPLASGENVPTICEVELWRSWRSRPRKCETNWSKIKYGLKESSEVGAGKAVQTRRRSDGAQFPNQLNCLVV